MDVLVAGIVLAGSLVAILGLASRSLSAQVRGEQMQRAAMVLDGLLTDVLAIGPEAYLRNGSMSGTADPPFQEFTYRIRIEEQSPRQPYRVIAQVQWIAGGVEHSTEVQTLIALRRGEEPDPERRPENPIQR